MNASTAIAAAERWRLRASDFELLFQAGALDDVRKAELIDGDIYAMSPQTSRHSLAKTELAYAIITRLRALGGGLRVMVEVSVVVAETSVPEPDIVIASYKGDRFVPAETIALVVEVSTSTLATDLGRKAELYAAANIPEYWVVDVGGERVTIHTRPTDAGYLERVVVPYGEPLTSTAIQDLTVDSGVLRF